MFKIVFWLAWHFGKHSRVGTTERVDFFGMRFMRETV